MRKIFSLIIMIFFAFPAFADQLTEPQKIDALLDELSDSGVTLIRNGISMDAQTARKHLEDKIKETKDIKTAEDFITKVASQSVNTGKPYIIKFNDGIEVESAKWFHEKLQELSSNDQPVIE